MELLTTSDEKKVWFQELSRPYQLASPFQSEPYVCVLFANDKGITPLEQTALSEQLVRTGCRYAVCAGYKCSTWDDSVDAAYLASENFSPRDETFVMTTWHDNEPVEDVIFYGLMNTMFSDHVFHHYLVLFVGDCAGLRKDVERAIQSVWSQNPEPKT